MNINTEFFKLVKDHAIEGLQSITDTIYIEDLHNELFNTDYFVVGYYRAKEILKECNYDPFEAIDDVIEYEKDNFGEVSTKINAEAIVNMLAYIYGYEVLNESENYKNYDSNKRLTEERKRKILNDLQGIEEEETEEE